MSSVGTSLTQRARCVRVDFLVNRLSLPRNVLLRVGAQRVLLRLQTTSKVSPPRSQANKGSVDYLVDTCGRSRYALARMSG